MVRNPFKRSADIPSEVLARASLRRGERVLAAAQVKDGTWLLGTGDALLILGPSDAAPADSAPPAVEAAPPAVEAVSTRIPWEQVERAEWARDEEMLRVSEVGQFGRARPEHAFEIDDPGLLLQLVRERVTASVVLQRRVVVSGKKGLFVVARRPPRGGGEIAWAYEFDLGVDPEDPAVMEAAQFGLRTAAAELGL